MAEEKEGWGERLTDAYRKMLERVRHRIDELEHDTGPVVQRALDDARERATELGELSREEAEKLGGYLRRDLEEAAEFVADGGRELGEWIQFDIQVVERSLADLFAGAVDRTRVELGQLSERASAFGEWHTGEVTGLGSLQCKSCGEVLHFQAPSHIPPCPRCHGTSFRRVSEGE